MNGILKWIIVGIICLLLVIGEIVRIEWGDNSLGYFIYQQYYHQ